MSGIILWWSVLVYCNYFGLFVNKSKEVKKKGGPSFKKSVWSCCTRYCQHLQCFQVWYVLVEHCDVPHLQLSASSVNVASQILLKLGRVLKSKHKRIKDKWIEARDLLSREFVQSATRVTSNLIEAASLLMQRYDAVSLLFF